MFGMSYLERGYMNNVETISVCLSKVVYDII